MERIVFKKEYFAIFLIISVCTLLAAQNASALTLKLESSGGTTITIDDNGAGDDDGTVGVIIYNGPFDAFTVVNVIGMSKPALGDPTHAHLNLTGISATGSTAGVLIISLTDTNFGPGSGDTTFIVEVGGTTDGTTAFEGLLDPANAAFGTSASVCSSGLQGPFGPGAFDATVTTSCTLSGFFSATVAVTASLSANGVQSFGGGMEADIPQDEEEVGCRFTGGGVDTDLNWDHTLEDGETIRNGAGNLPAGIDRYQFGGQVGARTAQQPLPSGEWQHHQQTGPSGDFAFHGGTSSAAEGTWIVDVRCSDPGFCFPARPAPAKQLDFDAIGTFSNMGKGNNAPTFELADPNVIPEPKGKKDSPFTFHWFEVNIDDLGEPGRFNMGAPNSDDCPGRGFGEKSDGLYDPDPVNNPDPTGLLPFTELANCDCPDFYRVTIYKGVLSDWVTYLPDGSVDPNSMDRTTVIYEAFGYIDGGNLQIHPPTGFDLK